MLAQVSMGVSSTLPTRRRLIRDAHEPSPSSMKRSTSPSHGKVIRRASLASAACVWTAFAAGSVGRHPPEEPPGVEDVFRLSGFALGVLLVIICLCLTVAEMQRLRMKGAGVKLSE